MASRVYFILKMTHSYSSLGLKCHTHGPLAKRLMHRAHKSGNTSGVKSSSDWLNYTGFLVDARVLFFNAPPRKKDAVVSKPLKKEAIMFTTDDKCLS